jgi:tetratricopeptide (TPR) repeat protein
MLIAAAVVGVFLGPAGAVQAGLYNSAEEPDGPNVSFAEFQGTLLRLRNPNSGLHKRGAWLRSVLSKPRVAADLSVEDRLNLGAYLIRVGDYQQALQVLGAAEAQEPRNFLILSNMATAHQLNNQLGEAVLDLQRALRAWPADPTKLSPAQLNACRQLILSGQEQPWYPELNEAELDWCKKVGWVPGQLKQLLWFRQLENYQLKLLKLRAKGPKVRQEVDALFDDGGEPPKPVRFVGASGQYEPGTIAAGEEAKLPKHALAIVEQLLVWLPNDPDPGLEWLRGELLNAQGRPDYAELIFRNLGDRLGKRAPSELNAHRETLQTRKGDSPAASSSASVAGPPPPEPWKPNPWQTLAVGFAAGLVVALLGYWQVREILRRRAAGTVLSKH